MQACPADIRHRAVDRGDIVILLWMPHCGMSPDGQQAHGNLMSYKVYVRPAAHGLYGYGAKAGPRHRQNVHGLLSALFVHGAGTTWDMAKARLRRVQDIREQEKAYRRLLIGRTDRGRHSGGILDIGLAVRDGEAGERRRDRPYAVYRLSMYGILYCIDALEPAGGDVDRMAERYAFLLPRVFGRWKELGRALGSGVAHESLRILSKGLYLNNAGLARAGSPLYELMSFLHVKYRHRFESISQDELSEQVSYWFFTSLLYLDPGGLRAVLAQDGRLRRWYADFFREARGYYAERLRTMRGYGI